MKKEQISPEFLEQLEQDGFPVQAILAEIKDDDPFGEAMKKIRLQTGFRYPKRVIQRALNGRREQKINQDVENVINWLKSKRPRRFVLEADNTESNAKLLINDLEQFSQGKPTDFIIWNCLGFDWEQNPTSEYPSCRLTDNLDVSIVCYFLPRLEELINQLSNIGNPTIIPMVPSTEATYESMWTYKQSRKEREDIVESAVNGLKQKLELFQFPNNAAIEPIRWDEYLKTRNVTKDPLEYAREGEQRLKDATDFWNIRKEAIQSGVEYFKENGIKVDTDLIADKRIRYYGMYEGEGEAMADIRESGRNIIVINLEEFRVSKMALRGAEGKLPIVTPISDKEMTAYYQRENRMKKQRKSSSNDSND